ncbi:MAG: hypothetical protein CL666_08665 [Balneola sp.]|nr:hypothetical protein [Balneola sp.]|tara:strand:+ start:18624 stop:18980 length:357 start_codon:yes stop_codon:yes gene_type:complete
MQQIDDIVTLTSARGGWQGVISDIVSLGNPELYRVENLTYGDVINGSCIVAGSDIASSNTDYPEWEVGQSVNLYNLRGTIQAIDGRMITVQIIDIRSEDITFTRTHIVPRWRLLIENN